MGVGTQPDPSSAFVVGNGTTNFAISPFGQITTVSDIRGGVLINATDWSADLINTGMVRWSSTGNYYNSADVSLSRLEANKLGVGTGAQGSVAGTLIAANIGVGTTSPYAKLSVVGETVAAYFTATTTATSTFPRLLATQASTTNLAITGVIFCHTHGMQECTQ
jgi:hypothetical protein